MPQTATPAQIPTGASKTPGYHGEQPGRTELQMRDAPIRALEPIYGPPSLQPTVGISRRTSQDPTNGMTYFYTTPLFDFGSLGYGHPLMMIDRNRIPLKAPPDNDPAAQAKRRMNYTPFWQNWQAPSLNQVATFMGGYQNG